MRKFSIIAGIAGFFVFMALCTTNGYSEITLSQSDGTLKAVGTDGTVQLNAETTSATVADLTGGSAAITYDAATGAIDAKGSGTTVGLTYSIAKIYLDSGEGVKVGPSEGYGGFEISNTSGSGDVVVIFPDMSKISMPVGSNVSFVKLADGNYYMKVNSGTVQYTDPEGRTRTLGAGSPPMLVQGYEQEPGWRSDELQAANPATP